MKFKTEREFKAEEMYDLFEYKYSEQLKAWISEINSCQTDQLNFIDKSAELARKMVYGKYLLDVVHTVDLELEEINQAIKIMSGERKYSSVVDAFIKFGVEPTLQSVNKYFKLVLKVTLWYEQE